MMIRKARAEDWGTIKEICCKTANVGNPIDEARWPFFGDFWVGPYQKLVPEWTYVVEKDSTVLGYLTGCPHSRRFEDNKSYFFTPRMVFRTLTGRYPINGDSRRFLKRTFGLEKGIEARFSSVTHQTLACDYPAHLHINFLAELRGSGTGRMLLDRYFSDLKSIGIKGVHCFCGAAPVPFYERTGFKVLERIEFAPGVPIFAMVRPLD